MTGVDRGSVRALAAETSDSTLRREIDDAVDTCFAPIRLQVAGRAGVGKSSVRAVLTMPGAPDVDAMPGGQLDDVEISEPAALDVPRIPDPDLDGDVLVYVLSSGAQSVDVDVVTSTPNVVPVLAKADTVDDISGVVERLSTTLGVPVVPLMGAIAASTMRGQPSTFDPLRPAVAAITSDVLLTPERFLRARLPLPRRIRVDLVEQIETFGVRIVVDALRADPAVDDATLRQLLAEKSGMDAVLRVVRHAVEGVRVDRHGRLLHRLTALATQYPDAEGLERYLGSDDAVVATMRSALRALGETADPNPSLRLVQQWRDRWQTATDAADARASLAVARGYLRMRPQ